ncbi:uncharacterized protein EDB93DRAFT_1331395 [Suillus bovinus]|uniref:uncharacterized protein n=1 Tax=Suillus bovinus TaxID=48563 RepID=UPI001B882542|nr:uncharacterized protein EDB93DRAFT_1331395 [Suillus bovinus]KAG2133639.1 hypothetical protein EDB93DRAFT_1331395 [Suillus bovinus]
MQKIEGVITNSQADFSPLLEIICAPQTVLARCEETITDLETSHSKSPNTDQSTMEKDVSDIIAKRHQQLDTVLLEISGVESVMYGAMKAHQKLVEKKDRITQSISLHKGLVSGLRRLPTEILSEIFHHCLPESCDQLPSGLQAPLLLTEVCRRWREVAIGTRSLWSRLSVQVDYRRWGSQASGYDLWLRRSRGCPLSLVLSCQETDPMRIQRLLQPYMKQIATLSVAFERDVLQPGLLLHELPALQELAIQGVRDSYGYFPAIPRTITRLPHTLRSLKVVDRRLNTMRLTPFSPAMAHLTNLDIAILQYPSAVLHLLQLCPNLSSLKIHIQFGYRVENLESFTHTKIQTLHIRRQCPSADDLSSLLNALSLPSLRVIKYHCDHGLPCFHNAMREFLARSKCPLESLVFSGLGIPAEADEELEQYLDIIPSLEIRLVEDHT